MSSTHSTYRSFDAEKIVETTASLERRIAERFGDAGLRKIAAELNQVAREAVVRSQAIREPIVSVRVGIWTVVIAIIALIGFITPRSKLDWHNFVQSSDFLQNFDAGLESFVLLGAALLSLVTVESRFKRNRALKAIHELRAMAHIIDMHQLTKDPERITRSGPSTASSPRRSLTPFELGRYLDYCSELLSLASKIGAVYVQDFPDPTALAAADQLATLTNDLSRTIWQKIMILDIATGPESQPASSPAEPRTTVAADTPREGASVPKLGG
jgi:hypothetical protein